MRGYHSAMFRRWLAVVLMVLVPLQAYGAVAGAWAHASNVGLLHLVDHEGGIAHHHHDDGSVQQDDSDESAQHLCDHAYSSAFTVIVPQLRRTPSAWIAFQA